MNVPTRLGAFLLTLFVVFAAAYGVGAVTGPVAGADPVGHEPGGDGPASHEETGSQDGVAAAPGGLAVSAEGYTLRRLSPDPRPGAAGVLAFQILGPDGAPVTRYQTSHEKDLHLIVVRRDLTGFQHRHPEMAVDGTWRTDLTLPAAGDWRIFADFQPAGTDRSVILGTDVPVAGAYQPARLPDPAPLAQVDDYTVEVHGELVAGRTSRLTMTVARRGTATTDLQPYLGALGHLVALRAGDLAYLHVHPLQTTAAGPEITVDVEVPSAGAYRLFLQFQHEGTVRTVEFTASVT